MGIYMDERTYKFIERYGQAININNDICFNEKTINIMNDRHVYNELLFKALDENKKIIMPMMSENEAMFYEVEINKRYPSLEVKLYTGKTGDEEKAELINIKQKWDTYDVIIFTPTIEAGVSFDKERYDVIFGIISDGVASQRSYFQMMARVRKIKDNDIYLGNFNNCKINNCILETFDNYKAALRQQKDIKLKTCYKEIEGEMKEVFINDFYDDIYCYNKVEDENKAKYSFLLLFKKLALKKGFQFNIIEKLKNEIKSTKPDGTIKRNLILNANEINDFQCKELLEKQNKNKVNMDENYKITKFMMKKELGADILDDEIIKTFSNKNYVNKFLSLIDIKNISHELDENKYHMFSRKAEIITTFLKRLGFDKIITNKMISSDDINNILTEEVQNKADIFNNNNKILFKSQNKNLSSPKGIMGYLNCILKNYSLKISSKQVHDGAQQKMINYYKLDTLNGIQDIIKMKNKLFIDTECNLLKADGEFINKTLKKWGHLVSNERGNINRIITNDIIYSSYVNAFHDIFDDEDDN